MKISTDSYFADLGVHTCPQLKETPIHIRFTGASSVFLTVDMATKLQDKLGFAIQDLLCGGEELDD